MAKRIANEERISFTEVLPQICTTKYRMEKLKIKPFFWNGKRWFTIAEAERIRNYQLVYSFKRSLILVLECWIKHPTIPLPDLADMTNTDLFEVEKTIDEYKKSGCIIVGSKMNHSGFDRGF